jgi:hypothetical protein
MQSPHTRALLSALALVLIQGLLLAYSKGADGVSPSDFMGSMAVEAVLGSLVAPYALWWVRGIQEPPPGSLEAHLGRAKPRSLWGWLWRGCVVFVVKAFAYLPALVLVNQWLDLPSEPGWTVLGAGVLPLLSSTLLAAWLLFCPDRLAWPRRWLAGAAQTSATAPQGPADVATRPADLVQGA